VAGLGAQIPAETPAEADGLSRQAGNAGGGEGTAVAGTRAASLSRRLRRRAAAVLTPQADPWLHALRPFRRRLRPRDWRRRYFVLLTAVHRRVFDRKIEQLLFFKTPGPGPHSVPHPEGNGKKLLLYEGPISRKVLYWALSALPDSLKHYAFVDFH